MKLPNKVITYKESTISKFPILLSCLKEQDMSPASLYKKIKSQVEDIGEYIDILDCLYALGKIELIEHLGVLYYVD